MVNQAILKLRKLYKRYCRNLFWNARSLFSRRNERIRQTQDQWRATDVQFDEHWIIGKSSWQLSIHVNIITEIDAIDSRVVGNTSVESADNVRMQVHYLANVLNGKTDFY